jgi:hypothetical protein
MAKRKRARTAARTTTKIIKAAAPIIRVAAPRAVPAKRRRSSTRRAHSGGLGGGIISNEAIQMAIGGALYGYAVKSGLVAKLPAIPVLGRTGTAAILLDYFSRHGGGQLAHRAARAAAAIAGYQLGSEGAIQGDLTTTGDFVTTGDFAMGDASPPSDHDGY